MEIGLEEISGVIKNGNELDAKYISSDLPNNILPRLIFANNREKKSYSF